MSQGAASVSLLIGMAVFATTTALLHLTGRRRWQQREVELTARLNAADARAERIEAMLSGEPQVVISWGARTEAPLIEGNLDCLDPGASLLAFGTWASSESAQKLETALDALKQSGEAFFQTIHTKRAALIEVAGRAVGGRAVLRMREVNGIAAELNQIKLMHLKAEGELDALRGLVDSLPYPVWTRDAAGQVSWANSAYLAAVEAADLATLKARSLELLDQANASVRHRCGSQDRRPPSEPGGRGWSAPYPRSVRAAPCKRQRRHCHRCDPGRRGPCGSAADRWMHMPPRLTGWRTAVAIFDSRRSLVFRNPAFDRLWGFEAAFLDSQPSHSDVLDRQRALRRAPELVSSRRGRPACWQPIRRRSRARTGGICRWPRRPCGEHAQSPGRHHDAVR